MATNRLSALRAHVVGAPHVRPSMAAVATSAGPRSADPPPVTTLDCLKVGRDAMVGDVVRRLDEYGVCIIERLAPESVIQALDEQIILESDTHLLDTGAATKDYSGGELLVRAPAVVELVEQPLVLGAARTLLERHCKQIALKILTIISTHPGKHLQRLHREDGLWPAHHAPFQWCVDALWALSDFTVENGATYCIPRSQNLSGRWARDSPRETWQSAHDHPDAVQAIMPRGSVVLFTGGTLHCSGKNVLPGPAAAHNVRMGLNTGYQLGWLQQEHRFWTCKRLTERIGEYSETMQGLLGFSGLTNAEEGHWCGVGAHDYLARTADQANGDDARSGANGLDEPFYHGSEFFADGK